MGIGSKISAFARDATFEAGLVCRYWIYGDGRYLGFQSVDGVRYWRVTDRRFQLDQKKIYSPSLARNVVRQHAHHWCSLIKNEMAKFPKRATITTCFDTELFGHWWHEGPLFLEEVIRTLSQDTYVRVTIQNK